MLDLENYDEKFFKRTLKLPTEITRKLMKYKNSKAKDKLGLTKKENSIV